jgi:hypothetical protein
MFSSYFTIHICAVCGDTCFNFYLLFNDKGKVAPADVWGGSRRLVPSFLTSTVAESEFSTSDIFCLGSRCSASATCVPGMCPLNFIRITIFSVILFLIFLSFFCLIPGQCFKWIMDAWYQTFTHTMSMEQNYFREADSRSAIQ